MGKKRRYIQRSRKFTTKYFKILDGFDGTDDGHVKTQEAFIDTLTVTDNQNQTVTLSGRVLGNADGATNKGVEYSLNGAAFVAVSGAITDNDSNNLDEFTFSVNPAPGSSNHFLTSSAASHRVIVRPSGITNSSRSRTADFTVRENKIVVNLDTNCFSDSTDNNIKFDASKCTITSGKKKAGNTNNAVLGGGGSHAVGIRISITHNGVTKTIVDKSGGGAAATQTIAKTQTFSNTSEDIAEILEADADAAGEPLEGATNGTTTDYVCTVVPLDSDNTPLTESAVTQTVTVTKVA